MAEVWEEPGGITLERFAELCAACGDERDTERQTEIVTSLGVARSQWEAARDGWMARMHDPHDAGHTTARFNPLYAAARDRVIFGSPVPAPTPPPTPTVAVQWSDGRRYRATVVQRQDGHTLVTFADGRQQWVPDSSLGP